MVVDRLFIYYNVACMLYKTREMWIEQIKMSINHLIFNYYTAFIIYVIGGIRLKIETLNKN